MCRLPTMAKNSSVSSDSLIKGLGRLSDEGGSYLVIAKPKEYQKVKLALLRMLGRKFGPDGSFVDLNMGYSSILPHFKEGGLDPLRMSFIDGVSKQSGRAPVAKNCVCIDGPESLTELSIAVSSVAASQKSRYMVLDSANTLLMYNNPGLTQRFLRSMSSRVRSLSLHGFFLVVDEPDAAPLIQAASQFVDKCIRV